VVEDCPETAGELLKMVQRHISLSPHSVGPLQGFPGEARVKGRHPLMVRWSWVDRGQIEVKLKEDSHRTSVARRDGSHWAQAGKGRSGQTPVVLVEALPAVHCLDNAIHGSAQMVKHNRMLLDVLLHLHGRGTFSC
jgi:hypothetical protein